MNLTHLEEYLRENSENERIYLQSLADGSPVPSYFHTVWNMQSASDLDITDTEDASRRNILSFFNNMTYLDGIIVSRQDRYLPIHPHSHEFLELVYMYSGSCVYHIDGKTLPLFEGQTLLINHHTMHTNEGCGENDILLNFLIRKDYLDANFFSRFSNSSFLSRFFVDFINERTDTEHFIWFPSDSSRRLPLFIREFLCEYYDKSINSKDYLDSYTTLIFLELTEILKNDMSRGNRKGQSQMIFPILRYIEENFRTCTLAQTAAFFNLNPNYLSGFIRQNTGQTFISLVQNQKLLLASRLLQSTGLPVEKIAEESGYENVTFFYRKFREKYHCSPAEYRRQHSPAAY